MTIELTTTVGELVRERPARSRIFEQLQIDYCCGGAVPLGEACAKRGLDPQAVAQQIRQLDAEPATGDEEPIDADAMTLTDLANHIEQTHHAYLKAELPRLAAMTQKVFEVHGESDPRLAEVRRIFAGLHQELSSHLMKEEQVLFPMIRQLESSDHVPAFHCGTVANPIRQMEYEHDGAGHALAILRFDGWLSAARVGVQHVPRNAGRTPAARMGLAPAHPQREQRVISQGDLAGG